MKATLDLCLHRKNAIHMGPCLCDHLNTKNADMTKVLLSLGVNTKVLVKEGLPSLILVLNYAK